MPNVTVLGAGMVGSVMAADFARDATWRVTIADASAERLEAAQRRFAVAVALGQRERSGAGGGSHSTPALTTRCLDLSEPGGVRRAIDDADLVLGALSSSIAFGALRATIEARKHYCDIAFMGEDALALSSLAVERGVTAVVDCGVAPGMSHMLATLGASQLDRCERVSICVGGLPRVRSMPFQYKAAFAPSDVLEEYTRPARLVEHGRVVTKPALSDPEYVDFDQLGTLEAFNTDGLRSLVATHGPGTPRAIPSMVEKTLRYPGHADLMRALSAAGLLSSEAVRVGGAMVSPRDLLSAVIFPKWAYGPDEEDLTIMRVDAEGTREQRPWRVRYDLFDVFDRASQATSMARTTALPCAIVGRLIHAGRINTRGVIAPELLGYDHALMAHLLEELHGRGVRYVKHSGER
jgi:lysine 6-dehydrogenase